MNCLDNFGQTEFWLNLEGAGSMMDVFTGISRNTTSTRCFPDILNNLVIFPREPDQELNHGLGKFWSLTLFDEIPEILTNFGFVARRWFVARSCVQFFWRKVAACWWIFGQWHANLHNHNSAFPSFVFPANLNNQGPTLSSALPAALCQYYHILIISGLKVIQ